MQACASKGASWHFRSACACSYIDGCFVPSCRLRYERQVGVLEGDVARLRQLLEDCASEEVRRQEALRVAEEARTAESQRMAVDLAQLEARALHAETTVASAIAAVSTLSGCLEKKGHKWTTGWRQRECVLEGQSLRYYKKAGDEVPRGTVSLIRSTTIVYSGGAREFQVGHSGLRVLYCFLFACVCECAVHVCVLCFVLQIMGASDGRSYYFRSSTAEDAAVWVKALQAAVSLLSLPTAGSVLSLAAE